jgi:hypothetical protein
MPTGLLPVRPYGPHAAVQLDHFVEWLTPDQQEHYATLDAPFCRSLNSVPSESLVLLPLDTVFSWARAAVCDVAVHARTPDDPALAGWLDLLDALYAARQQRVTHLEYRVLDPFEA